MSSRNPSVLLIAFSLVLSSTAHAGQAHFEGAIGPGSVYEIDVPDPWNGHLVLYAHGIVPADLPVAPPSLQEGFPLIRATLLAAGYAVAASSYSSNGWALADAVQQTHQLGGIFRSKVEQPVRTFLMGHSLGALAIVKLAERYPRQFDGVLAMCGPLGGALEELRHAGDARVTFDFYFPGILPGTTFTVPPGTGFLSPLEPGGPSPLFLSVFNALSANPAATLQWATAARLPFADAAELGNTALFVIGFLLRHTNDFIDRVNGKIPYDNSLTSYQVNVADPATNAVLSALLNAGVQRFEADRAALNYYVRNYTPTGDLDIPVLTLHTTRDPAIPIAHETLFAAAVANAGRSDFLVQQTIDRWGHCAFTPAEASAAFSTLVQWVETGQQP